MSAHGALARVRLAASAALVLVLAVPDARAGPTLWQSAQEPRLSRQHDVHWKVIRLRLQHDEARHHNQEEIARFWLLEARRLLTEVGARSSNDAELRYDLAEVLYDLGTRRRGSRAELVEARDALLAALELAPHHPRAAPAYFCLANTFAKLDDTTREIEAATRALGLEWLTHARAVLLSNRGEAFMRLGDLEQALRDFRASLDLARFERERRIALWNLGVALSRAGDLRGAFDALREARVISPRYDPSLDHRDVFFVPEHDRYYYGALGAMAAAHATVEERAAAERDPRSHLLPPSDELLARSIDLWDEYLERSGPGDRWLRHAEHYRARCVRQRAERTARAQNKPSPRPPRGGPPRAP